MYGIVNDAIQGLITANFGEDAWERVKLESKVDVDHFLSQEPYPDSTTYALAQAASNVLNMPLSDVLFAFGEYWVLVTAKEKYGALLSAGGHTLKDFLVYLPNLHNHVMLLYPDLRPPEFQVSDVQDTNLKLHYISEREGLQDFVSGLISGMGKLFETSVSSRLLESRAEGASHEIYEVNWA